MSPEAIWPQKSHRPSKQGGRREASPPASSSEYLEYRGGGGDEEPRQEGTVHMDVTCPVLSRMTSVPPTQPCPEGATCWLVSLFL